MFKQLLLDVTSAFAVVSPASAAILGQWDFNATPLVTAGTGTSVVFSTTGAWNTTVGSGSPADLGANNRSMGIGGLPASLAPSVTEGMGWTTNGSAASNLTVSLHIVVGYRASRYYQLQGTTDGTTWNNLTGGTPIQPTTLGTGVASASVSATGLIDIRMNDGIDPTSLNAPYSYTYGYMLPSSYDNKPTVGFRLMSAWDSTAGDYVSSFAGTTAADATKGYSTAANAGGDLRVDLVTISGTVPEPAAVSLLAFAGLAVGRRSLRARNGK